jgi:hypothetical protein
MNIELKKFNLSKSLNEASVYYIYGHPNSGKTRLAKHFIDYKLTNNLSKQVVVITPPTNSYSEIDDATIHDKYDNEIIGGILLDCRETWRSFAGELYKKRIENYTLVLDDIFLQNGRLDKVAHCSKNNMFQFLFTHGRCYNMTTIMTTHFCFPFSPLFRPNIDFFFVLTADEKFYAFYEEYLRNTFPTFEDFHQTFELYKQKNENTCFVFDFYGFPNDAFYYTFESFGRPYTLK